MVMAEDIDRGVTKEARDFANYCGLVLRTTAKVSEGGWKNIRAKHGETMYLKVKVYELLTLYFEINQYIKNKYNGYIYVCHRTNSN